MKYFVFRNQTVEAFFDEKDVCYSGYGDIGVVPEDARGYIWFYQVPPGEGATVAVEVASFYEKLEFVLRHASPEKQFVVFTLVSTANTQIVSGDFALQLAIEDFNRRAAELALANSYVRLVDFSDFTRRYRQEDLVNWKFYFISQTLLNPKLSRDFRAWWESKEAELALMRKKCLVLDADNTLWGGTLGEDGVTGIEIGGDYPGKAFTYWQSALLELKNSGVMLALCSKNNEADVVEAWESNPFMVLKKEHFAAWRINWQDKATNIRKLAEELNIGLDSMVFLDDNPTERELVRQMLPHVEVPEFPERPHELMSFYSKLVNSYFHVYSITNEDKQKTEQYKARAERATAQSQFSDFSDYLRSLDIKVDILPLDEFNLARIAQMTQKTNQFNLTTRRLTESDIRQLRSEGCLIYCIGVSDRFGDNGITGEIIMKPESSTTMTIDTFLLSCRILGKGIEFAFLNTVLNHVGEKGVKSVKGVYRKTAKNAQVADFYERAGFTLTSNTQDERCYTLELDKPLPVKDYYTITFTTH